MLLSVAGEAGLTTFPSRPATTTSCGTGSGCDRRQAENRSQNVLRRFLVAGCMVYQALEDELLVDAEDEDEDEDDEDDIRFVREERDDCWACSLDSDSSIAWNWV